MTRLKLLTEKMPDASDFQVQLSSPEPKPKDKIAVDNSCNSATSTGKTSCRTQLNSSLTSPFANLTLSLILTFFERSN
ncbi:hypothetical protein HanPSC8_Chr02g0058731 [Helianthus annuus]|nr:hypothetical protein HanPSC8_Chr02g0058731 [Helianthus annuus]